MKQIELEEYCRSLYRRTSQFYDEISTEFGADAYGFKILYGPPIAKAKLLFIGFQPGGDKSDAIEGERVGERVRWPNQNEYLTANWPLANKVRQIWDQRTLEQSVALNLLFMRSPNRDKWANVSEKTRRKCESYCTAEVRSLLEIIRPQNIVIVGLGSVPDFVAEKHDLNNQTGRRLMSFGSLWSFPTRAIIHLTGARPPLTSADIELLRQHVNDDNNSTPNSQKSSGPQHKKLVSTKVSSTTILEEVTPQNVVRALKYLRSNGMTESQLRQIHHLKISHGETFLKAIEYFSRIKTIVSDTNKNYGSRLIYVADEHSTNKTEFGKLCALALQKWPKY